MNKKKLVKKHLFGSTINVSKEALNNALKDVSDYGLKALGWIGNQFVDLFSNSPDYGLTSPFVFSSSESRNTINKSKLKSGRNGIITSSMYISPSNYIAALTQGSLNPKTGAEIISRLSSPVLFLSAIADMVGLAKAPKIKYIPRAISSTVDNVLAAGRNTKIGRVLGSNAAAGRIVGRQLGLNVGNTKLGIKTPIITALDNRWLYSIPLDGVPENSNVVHRTGAMNFNRKVKSGEINLEDPNTAVIELKSTPEGEATVKQRHMYVKDKDGNLLNITFSYNDADVAKYPNRLLQLIFDDNHPQSGYITKLSEDLVRLVLASGQWPGTPIAENPRAITFTNISPEQARQAIDFFDNNKGNNIWVHCWQGKSRSGAYDKFLRDMYGYQYPKGATTDMYSPEVYKALVKAYMNKHNGISYYH